MPEEVIKELERLVTTDKVHTPSNASTVIVFQSYPKPIAIFTGRRDERKRFKEAFSKSSFISIEGLGGIGKTEFAAKCIEEFLPADKIVWLDCLPDSKLDALIDNSGYPDVLKGENKTELAKYSGFADLIERDERIIFLDNFQDISDASFKNFFKFAERRIRKAKIVIISRESQDIGVRLAPVQLNGLKDDSLDYARSLIETYYNDVRVRDDNLKEICDNVKGHPFAIELAIQLLRYGETPDNILQKITQEKSTSEQLSNKLLDEIFRHPRSTDEERNFMLQFSVLRGEVDKKVVLYVVTVVNVSDALRRLYDKKMISRSSISDLYSTHPLIREFCYQKLENKKDSHLRAAEYFETQRKDIFDPAIEEEIFYHLYKSGHFEKAADLVSQQGEAFILAGHTNSLIDMIDKMMSKGIERPEFCVFHGDIETIRGEWNSAAAYFEKAFLFPEVNEKIMSEAYIKYGEILFRKGDVKESLRYFEDAYETCKRSNYKKEEARSLNDLGLFYDLSGEFNLAEKMLNEALHIRELIGDKKGLKDSLNNIGNILLNKGDINKALDKHRKSLEIGKEIHDRQGIAQSYNVLGHIFMVKGDTQEALTNCNEALRIFKEIGNVDGISVALRNLGNVLSDMKRFREALDYYQKSLEISEEIGNKHGISATLDVIGNVFLQKGSFAKALYYHNESLKIAKEIGGKNRITSNINNLGNVFLDMGRLEAAFEKYNESLSMHKDMGNKGGIAVGYHNLGAYYYRKKDYLLSLRNFFQSLALRNQMGTKHDDTLEYILQLRKTLGFQKFHKLTNVIFGHFPDELKDFINLEEFVEDGTIHRKTPKIGRNDPCTCGSGKKYKKCCGASSLI
jgi:tetratricopeptide (TPR) repeat protein